MKASDLHFLLTLDEQEGLLFWKERPFFMFNDNAVAGRWNSDHAGKRAFDTKGSDGYLRGTILGKKYLAHRVIWAMSVGDWPALFLDHVNGDRADNRLANLREVSSQENSRNSCLSSKNKSGVVGVHFNKARRTWVAQITENGKTQHLGAFHDINDAIARRKEAEREIGFHENHGRFPSPADCIVFAQEGR